MGRHRRNSPRFARRSSVIALTGLVPTGLMAAGTSPDVVQTDTAGISFVVRSPARTLTVAAAPFPELEPLREVRQTPEPPTSEPAAIPADPPLGRHPVAAVAGSSTIPEIAAAAYMNAERILAIERPTCELPWSLLAAIGRIESGHAFGGTMDTAGDPLTPIYGPALDGNLAGNAVIVDSDGGALDGLTGYDRAIGPMQFIPQTWQQYAADGNGDGIADPQNLYDATLAAGRYLCEGGLNMRDSDQLTRAILRYNNSMAYAVNVMAWEATYRTGGANDAAV
ncbi:lytic murein transglycosylase [Nocardia vinacea]|uniref:lytic murein transglycosylase n=1 Tax=Nocardia vinacea TaxID=96468 RepID=UPI0002DCF1C7|nr:lytic murein transglycosylase [Nocardia vinacea]